MWQPKSPLLLDGGYWLATKDGDPRAIALYKRHYSCHHYADGRERKLIAGPGYKMIMLTYSGDALFIWRKFISNDGQKGVNCSVFRNESVIPSSTLILEAMDMAWARWPNERLFTYVDPRAAGGDGKCFKVCGWSKCGRTAGRTLVGGEKKDRLYILEALPNRAIVERSAVTLRDWWTS